MRWTDLSGAELRARLRQRGEPEAMVELLVIERERPVAQAYITRVLSR